MRARPCDIWQIEATPFVDLNGDGLVDTEDVCIMVDHWHIQNVLCDIAPAALPDRVSMENLTM